MSEAGVTRAHREVIRHIGLRYRLGRPGRVIVLVRHLGRMMRVRMVVVVVAAMVMAAVMMAVVVVIPVIVVVPVIVVIDVAMRMRIGVGLVGRAAGAVVAAGDQRLVHDLADRAGAAAALGAAAEAAVDLAGEPCAALRDDVADLVVRQHIAGADDHGGRGFRYGWFSERRLDH